MEERPTVQMDGSSSGDIGFGADEAKTPPTIPIDDVMRQQQQSWPSAPRAPQAAAPPQSPAFGAPPPAARPFNAPPAQAPVQQPPTAAGATRVMGRPAPPPLLAWLAVVEGPGGTRGQAFNLRRETVIGRTTGEILLSGDTFVSGQHAKVRMEPSSADPEKELLVLYDLASANGTFAGSRQDYRQQQVYRHELHDGDFILVGETTLVFKQV
jgi:hypothetical protein